MKSLLRKQLILLFSPTYSWQPEWKYQCITPTSPTQWGMGKEWCTLFQCPVTDSIPGTPQIFAGSSPAEWIPTTPFTYSFTWGVSTPQWRTDTMSHNWLIPQEWTGNGWEVSIKQQFYIEICPPHPGNYTVRDCARNADKYSDSMTSVSSWKQGE